MPFQIAWDFEHLLLIARFLCCLPFLAITYKLHPVCSLLASPIHAMVNWDRCYSLAKLKNDQVLVKDSVLHRSILKTFYRINHLCLFDAWNEVCFNQVTNRFLRSRFFSMYDSHTSAIHEFSLKNMHSSCKPCFFDINFPNFS